MVFTRKTPALMMGITLALLIAFTGCSDDKKTTVLKFTPLKYNADALSPVISAETVTLHHGTHYKGYVTRANKMIADADLDCEDLVDLLKKIHEDDDYKNLYNNLGQALNHQVYFNSLTPSAAKPKGELLEAIQDSFGSFKDFQQAFIAKANSHFASGWVWLVKSSDGLKIMTTQDADNPVVYGHTPLLTIDLWEHSYYLDYQSKRGDYIKSVFTKHLNWKYAEKIYSK